ncbi:hypothetical protein PMZ80_000535 [Knufia obscura]|uniref:BTB domain-containing protein n=2 Tax=Knufia TaxID=430999 RepID=A0AAN8I649_9EURO|nr:hypothetical protein PMZ80_000535 [Knufia obscura]KAK5956537.1 hypothetical protein OHC33_002022 [Knufia fluminis]
MADTGQSRVLKSRLADEIIEIEVGQPVITFRIHKKLLQDHSSYFLKALEEKKYKEGKEKKVELHDVVPEAFDVVADWLYTRRQHRNFSDDGLRTVVEARLLADRLMCTSDWKNRIATKICEMFARAQDTTIYRESIDILDTVEMQDGCLMRQLLIDMVMRMAMDRPQILLDSDGHLLPAIQGLLVDGHNEIESLIQRVAAGHLPRLPFTIPDSYHEDPTSGGLLL